MTTTPTSSALYVDEFMINEAGSHGRPLCFSTADSEVYPKRMHTGESTGTVVVHVGVELDPDTVAMDQDHCSQLALLDVAISDVQRVRDALAAVTPTSAISKCITGPTGVGACSSTSTRGPARDRARLSGGRRRTCSPRPGRGGLRQDHSDRPTGERRQERRGHAPAAPERQRTHDTGEQRNLFYKVDEI